MCDGVCKGCWLTLAAPRVLRPRKPRPVKGGPPGDGGGGFLKWRAAPTATLPPGAAQQAAGGDYMSTMKAALAVTVAVRLLQGAAGRP